jgi:hypothetical protein
VAVNTAESRHDLAREEVKGQINELFPSSLPYPNPNSSHLSPHSAKASAGFPTLMSQISDLQEFDENSYKISIAPSNSSIFMN